MEEFRKLLHEAEYYVQRARECWAMMSLSEDLDWCMDQFDIVQIKLESMEDWVL